MIMDAIESGLRTKLESNTIQDRPKALAKQGLSVLLMSRLVSGDALTSDIYWVIIRGMDKV